MVWGQGLTMFCYSEKMVIVLVCEHAYRVRYSCVNIHSNIFIGSSYKLLASCIHTRLEWQNWNGLEYRTGMGWVQ